MVFKLKRLVLFTGLITYSLMLYSQAGNETAAWDLVSIYNKTVEKHTVDPLLQNGIYYEDPYYNAEGHPFFRDGEFHEGSLIYRNKSYEKVRMMFDIFDQQVIVNQNPEQLRHVNILANELLEKFVVDGRCFRPLKDENGKIRFYQCIAITDEISCYYYWFKDRSEQHKVGERMRYVFSDNKLRKFVLLDGEMIKYKNRRSFIRAFPKKYQKQIQLYISSAGISLKTAKDEEMANVIDYCAGLLMEEGERAE